ncbi:hypothetical protein Adt_02309 [Abeliophyllum distichum]|uniref:Uncharacterized protein n=1 Tax=Abeliophyllum distichum TaxID=126358 RepID=A0ABD1VVF1_9LAMI
MMHKTGAVIRSGQVTGRLAVSDSAQRLKKAVGAAVEEGRLAASSRQSADWGWGLSLQSSDRRSHRTAADGNGKAADGGNAATQTAAVASEQTLDSLHRRFWPLDNWIWAF